MKQNHFDVAVIGLGGMGCASVYHLSKAGMRVVGIDRLPQRSSLRASTTYRGVRHAYFDDDRHVRLAIDATAGFVDLERQAGTNLLKQCSGMLIGHPAHPVMTGVVESAKKHELPFSRISATTLRKQYPQLRFDPSMEGVVEERAGYVDADAANAAFLSLATNAQLHFDTTVSNVDGSNVKVRLNTNQGIFTADRVVWCTGAWHTRIPLTLSRQFQVVVATSGQIPFFNAVTLGSPTSFYALPNPDGQTVVGQHHGGRACSQSDAFVPYDEEELLALRDFVARTFSIKPEYTETRLGIYANTATKTGFVDFDEEDSRFVLCGGFSGHGYKFAPEVGASVTALLLGSQNKDAYSLWRKS